MQTRYPAYLRQNHTQKKNAGLQLGSGSIRALEYWGGRLHLQCLFSSQKSSQTDKARAGYGRDSIYLRGYALPQYH